MTEVLRPHCLPGCDRLDGHDAGACMKGVMNEAGSEVWPVLIWNAHGEETYLLGVYATREDAFRALKAQPNMTAYVDDKGYVRGRPKRERRPEEFFDGHTYLPERWACGSAEKVRHVKPEQGDGQ
jgi:hypothetical protein